jgi:hypothetical protein
LTTFSNISITRYQTDKLQSNHLQDSTPILHPESEAFQGKQLTLEKDGKLHKQSFVRLKHVYGIEVSKLRVYRWKCKAHDFRLDESSYGDLMETLGLVKEEWEDTDSALETATRRLHLLARPNSQQVSERQLAETTVPPQTPRTPSTFDYYNSHRSWLTSNTNPQSRHDSSISAPVIPQPSMAYYDRLADQVNATRNSARHAPPVPPQEARQPQSYYNPPTWPNSAIPQRNYDTVQTSSRPDRYIQPRNYVPPRSEPDDENSSWLFVKCVVGFVAVGAFYWWWDSKGKKK